MTPKKMLVLTLAKTNAVLAAATRKAGAGEPSVDQLAAGGLVARTPDGQATLTIPAEELAAKEVDYLDDVFRAPHGYLVDASGALSSAAPNKVNDISRSGANIKIDLVPAAAAADKSVLVIVDGGPNVDPLKFSGKTVLGATSVELQVSGIPAGSHLVLASVDGYASRMEVQSF